MIDLTERLHEAALRPTRPLDPGAIADLAERRTRNQRITGGAVVLGLVVALVASVVVLQRQSDPQSLDVVGVPDPLEGVSEDSWVRLLGRTPETAIEPLAPRSGRPHACPSGAGHRTPAARRRRCSGRRSPHTGVRGHGAQPAIGAFALHGTSHVQ